MKIVQIKYFNVEERHDSRGGSVVARFTNKTDALQLMREKPYYYLDKVSLDHIIYESFEEYLEVTGKKALRENALAKLTPEERSVLGI